MAIEKSPLPLDYARNWLRRGNRSTFDAPVARISKTEIQDPYKFFEMATALTRKNIIIKVTN